MDIRPEDVGYETRVFRLTSLKLHATLEICIGKKYEHEGKNRYNVYRVQGDAVGACIGYYDVDDSNVYDSDGDFKIQEIGEPTWTIESKAEPEKNPEKPKPEKISKSSFIVIETVKDGDCFYDSIARALYNTDYNPDSIQKLRDDLATYYTEHPDVVVSRYETCVGSNTLRHDSYYVKYWNLVLNDTQAKKYRQENNKKQESFESVVKLIKETEQDNITNGRIDVSLFTKKTKPLRMPAPNDKISDECSHLIADYFNGDKELDDDEEIITTYCDNLKTPKVWADDLVVSGIESLYNVLVIPLSPKTSRVESYTVVKESSYYAPNKETRFVIVEYVQPNHYKLIATDKKIFTWSELPKVIKDKCKQLTWYSTVERLHGLFPEEPTEPAKLVESDEETEPAVESDEEPEPVKEKLVKKTKLVEPENLEPEKLVKPAVPAGKYQRKDLEGKSITELNKILKGLIDSNDPAYINALKNVGKKPDIIDCILNPEDPKCKTKRCKPCKLNVTRKA